MILTAHQPVYLPWLGLFHKIALADAFVSFNQVQYQPKDWNNRNRIKSATGPTWLSVPVLRKGYLNRSYSDIEINNDVPWRRKHWESLRTTYAKAPHFRRYADYFEDVYRRDWRTLVALNESMLGWFLGVLEIDVPVTSAADHALAGEKSDLVLDMCAKLGADRYVFGAQGRDYADVAAFEAAGVEVMFQDYRHPSYAQLHGPFVPNLSIVDLLFNCGDDSLEILLSGNLGRQAVE